MAEIETCKKYPSRRFIFQESGRDIYVSYIYALTDIYCIPLQEKDFPFHTYMLLQIFTVFPFRKRIFQAEHSGP